MPSRSELRQSLLEEVKAALTSDGVEPEDALSLSTKLKGINEFGYAWRLLMAVRASDKVKLDPDLDLLFRQQISLCTYKDTHLNDEHRLNRALDILNENDHLKTSEDPETLGLAGAIHKRLWEVRKDGRELEQALKYYRLGHRTDKKQGFEIHQGYPGINAAFLLDLIASLEKSTDPLSQETADLVRDRIRTHFIPFQYM